MPSDHCQVVTHYNIYYLFFRHLSIPCLWMTKTYFITTVSPHTTTTPTTRATTTTTTTTTASFFFLLYFFTNFFFTNKFTNLQYRLIRLQPPPYRDDGWPPPPTTTTTMTEVAKRGQEGWVGKGKGWEARQRGSRRLRLEPLVHFILFLHSTNN